MAWPEDEQAVGGECPIGDAHEQGQGEVPVAFVDAGPLACEDSDAHDGLDSQYVWPPL